MLGYINSNGMGYLGEVDANGYNQVEVTPDFCNAVIEHRAAASTQEQFSCASKGFVGNRPQMSVAQLPPVAVQASKPTPPLTSNTIVQPVPTFQASLSNDQMPDDLLGEHCYPLNEWVNQNPMLAAAAIAAVFFL